MAAGNKGFFRVRAQGFGWMLCSQVVGFLAAWLRDFGYVTTPESPRQDEFRGNWVYGLGQWTNA